MSKSFLHGTTYTVRTVPLKREFWGSQTTAVDIVTVTTKSFAVREDGDRYYFATIDGRVILVCSLTCFTYSPDKAP